MKTSYLTRMLYALASAVAIVQSAFADPVAAPGGPYFVPLGGSLTLNGSASTPSESQNITSYEWALDDSDLTNYQVTGDQPATIPYATLIAAPPAGYGMTEGTNTIRLRVTDDSDPAKTATVNVTVTLLPLVIHEPFSQTAGVLNGKAASTYGLSGNWTTTTGTSAVNVVTPSPMVFGALAMSDGHANLLRSGNTNGRVVRSAALTDSGLLDDGATLWFSLVMMKTAGGGNNEWSGFALGSSHLTSGAGALTLQGGNGLGFRTRDTSVTVATWNGTTTPAVGGSLSLVYNQPTLIVGKIEWGATAEDLETITLYKPTPDLSNLGTGVSRTMTAVNQSTFNTISFSLRDVDAMNYDEIRFGASQEDVMPVDTEAPSLLSFANDKANGPIGEDVATVTYTLTFNKHMDLATITDADFENAGTASVTVGTITQVSPTVITVQMLPSSTGTLQLRIPASSELKSFANLSIDTTSAIVDPTIITINSGTTAPGTPTLNRWWDGSTISGVTNGASAGGSGTWNTSTTNWDRGAGFVNAIAWNNSDNLNAIFGGTAGTVTLAEDITLDSMTINPPSGGGSGYAIGEIGATKDLDFTGAKTVNAAATGTGTNQDIIIRAGITGSPTMNIAGRATNTVDTFSLLPGADVTHTIGTINMLNTNASNKRLILGGASTGNVVDTITWSVTNNQLMLTKAGAGSWTITNNLAFSTGGSRASRLYVEQGTLTLSDTNHFISHKIGVSTTRESQHTASNLTSKLIAKGTITIGDNREWFFVQNAGTLSPGPGVASLEIRWNANSSTNVSNGQFNMQTGSTYEWDIASSTSTDVINVQRGNSSNGNLNLGNMTIKVNDAGVTGTIDPTDQLTVFTYQSSVARSIGSVTIDISSLGAGWSGTPTLVDNGTGTIYITGLSYSAGSNYTVTYDGNGNTGGAVPVDGNAYAPAATVTVLGNTGNLVKTNFVFTGWNTLANGQGTHYEPAATFAMGGANVTLYAEWKTPYQLWAGAAAFGDDANGDGVTNGLAFLLGAANPTANVTNLLPTVAEDDGKLIMTFQVRNADKRGAATLSLQHSSDLGVSDNWTTVSIPETSGGPTSGVTFTVTPGNPLNTVVASIAASEAQASKLFGRVISTNP
jgi:uncharacterized repeat protein (TIGR02543 family)